jgi:hypothetical protein
MPSIWRATTERRSFRRIIPIAWTVGMQPLWNTEQFVLQPAYVIMFAPGKSRRRPDRHGNYLDAPHAKRPAPGEDTCVRPGAPLASRRIMK